MKEIICTIILSLFTTVSQAMEIDCWSGLQNIYHGIGKDVAYGDGYLFFEEVKTGKTLYVNGDCVVKYYKISPHKKK